MITASIVLYRNKIEECHAILNLLLESSVARIYLIDHSGNDHLSILRNYSDIIEYIPHENTGYGAGHNVALRKAMETESEYHLVLNADVIFKKNVISELADFMNHNPQVGLVMPKLLFADGTMQYACKLVPTPWDLFSRRFIPKCFIKKSQAHFTLASSGYDRIMNVPFLSGCFMFFRVSALKEIGLFDERFFMYAEDIDISRRMHEKYKTVFFPDVSIIHIQEDASRKNLRMLIIHIMSLIKYFNKWGWFFDKTRREINQKCLQELCK